MWSVWTLNTLACLRHASYIHSKLCKRDCPSACWCRCHSQNCIHRRLSSGHSVQWYGCNWFSQIFRRHLVGWRSPNSFIISHVLVHGFRSTTDVFSGCCPHRGWATCLHKCRWWHFTFHRDAAANFETHRRLDDVDRVTWSVFLCSMLRYAASEIIIIVSEAEHFTCYVCYIHIIPRL
jgi:hypothetical protein